ncbi:sterol desaturase family protein [Dongia sp.]|uniref:sterol desaturase family protein n=1 Tax=Dongia sp. TaxID=1977262 RepID=UPI0035AFEE1D
MITDLAVDGPQRSPAWLAFIATLIVAEYLWHRLRAEDGYDLKESAATLGIMAGQIALRGWVGAILAPLFLLAHEWRLFDLTLDGPLAWAALAVLVDFIYYWFHRCSHQIHLMWATHAVHHSSTRFNLTAAYRLGWTGLLSGGWLFILALVWLGFPPVAVATIFAANLSYQLFLHTNVVGKLGPLEGVFNTPSHHRVHHATNESCLDRNFGGILIIWDRLFGTFAAAPADEKLRFGVIGDRPSYNPFRIAFAGWVGLALGVAVARGWRGRLAAVFGRP